MKIEKKTWPEYFQLVLDGKKNFEIRLADFDVKEGDTLILKEWNPETQEYTGREIEKQVTRTINTKDINYWPEEEIEKHGLWVIGLN